MGRPLSLLCSWSGALKVSWAHLGERLDARPSGRALGHDEDPDGLDAAISGLGPSAGPAREGGPGGFHGVEGIGLAGVMPRLAVLAVHLDDMDPSSGEEAGDAGPIGPVPSTPTLLTSPKAWNQLSSSA